MKLSKRIKLSKYLVYVYVVLLALTGLTQTVLGIVIIWDHIVFNTLADNDFWKPVTILLSIGPFSFILCWLGWRSTVKRNRRILGLFSVLLIILVCTQFAVCAWALSLRWTLMPRSSKFEYAIDGSFELFFSGNFMFDSSHIWNKVQAQYECCGVDGHTDYRRGAVPWSCFTGSDTTKGTTKLNEKGCLRVLEIIIRKRLLYCSFIALITGILQSVGLFCTIQLIILLGRDPESEDIDLAAMSFQQKRAHIEMLQPLSNAKGLNRKAFMDTRPKSNSAAQP